MIDYLNICCPCYIQDSHKNSKLIIQCTSCKKYQHKFCMKSMVKMPRYLCPFCQLKKGALFFNILYSLIEPSLVEFNPNNKILNVSITFIPDTSVYSTFLKKFKDSPTAIIIRCLRLDNNGFSFHWPKMSKMYINEKILIDLTKKGSKLKDRMIALIPGKDYKNENIPKKFFLYDSNIFKIEDYLIEKKPNRFEIEINLDEGDGMEYKNFLISIDLCEIYKEPEPIINDIPIINSKNEIKTILSNNEEEENNILSIKEKISLLDIYTETDRIEMPARGINCCHLNVFDLKTFLIINRKTNKFQCPYCKRYSNDLYIDGNIYNFIKNPENDKIKEIYIDKNLNISLYDKIDKKIDNNISDTNSNSIDETCKTDINKSIEKHKHKEQENKHHNYHKVKKAKRKKPNLIQIIEDESDNADNIDNVENTHDIYEHDSKDVNINENDFNNSKCNIISDLGEMFNQIREEILSDKKLFNNEGNKSVKKSNNYDLNTPGLDNCMNDLHKLKIPVFKDKYSISLKKTFIRKRKRYKYNLVEDAKLDNK